MYGISPGSALSMIGHSPSTSISVLYIVTSFGSGVGNGLTKFSISVTLCQEGSFTECLPPQKVFVWILDINVLNSVNFNSCENEQFPDSRTICSLLNWLA